MTIVLIVIVGLVFCLAAWCLLELSRYRRQLASIQIEMEGKVCTAETIVAERSARIAELQASLQTLTSEKAELIEHLRSESARTAALHAELSQTRSILGDQSVLQDRLKSEGEFRIKAETQLAEAQASFETQRKLLGDAKVELVDTFNALSATALNNNNDAFLALAKSAFEGLQAQAKGELFVREKAIEGIVDPLKDALSRYEAQIRGIEDARLAAYVGVEEQLKNLATGNALLQKETGSLVSALCAPQVRGRWGEMTLRRTAELAGMSAHCDFTEQESFETETGRVRPDMMVNLPSARRIAVDAKAPLQAFFDACSAVTEAERRALLSRHAQIVRDHMNQLSARNYWEQFDDAPEFVVLFLPGESFFAAALEQDRTLIEDGMDKRVILATPTTLIALLRAVAFGWRQVSAEQNAKEISDLGKELYDRIKTFVEHLDSMGTALGRSVDAYNRAVGSLELRVLPSARRFMTLEAATGQSIPETKTVDAGLRRVDLATSE